MFAFIDGFFLKRKNGYSVQHNAFSGDTILISDSDAIVQWGIFTKFIIDI
jgi:hypothetical protein